MKMGKMEKKSNLEFLENCSNKNGKINITKDLPSMLRKNEMHLLKYKAKLHYCNHKIAHGIRKE